MWGPFRIFDESRRDRYLQSSAQSDGICLRIRIQQLVARPYRIPPSNSHNREGAEQVVPDVGETVDTNTSHYPNWLQRMEPLASKRGATRERGIRCAEVQVHESSAVEKISLFGQEVIFEGGQ